MASIMLNWPPTPTQKGPAKVVGGLGNIWLSLAWTGWVLLSWGLLFLVTVSLLIALLHEGFTVFPFLFYQPWRAIQLPGWSEHQSGCQWAA